MFFLLAILGLWLVVSVACVFVSEVYEPVDRWLDVHEQAAGWLAAPLLVGLLLLPIGASDAMPDPGRPTWSKLWGLLFYGKSLRDDT